MNPRMIALLCVVGCGPAKTSTPVVAEAVSTKPNQEEKEAKWECSYLDGSGNRFHFYRKQAVIHFRYDPMKPKLSSSGVYSGGTAKTGTLTLEQGRQLEAQMKIWTDNIGSHVKRRSKGVSSFHLINGEKSSHFLVPESQLKELNILLEPLRP